MKDIHAEPQYTVRTYEDDHLLNTQPIFDPFVHATIVFHLGRWDALKALFKPLRKRWVVNVDGSREASHVVFGGDYTELPQAVAPASLGY